MLSTLFRKAPVEDFAKSLAGEIVKRYPPAIDQRPEKRPSVNRLTRVVEDACARAVEFQDEHRLGWLGKAKLGNAFRWELTELGYTKQFIDFATEAIVVHVSRGRKS
jgi:hypothetical protein